MWRDDRQRARACRALLATVRLDYLWTPEGPTEEAFRLLEANGGPLSSGERVMVLASFALWNGSGGLTLTEILDVLDPTRAEALCTLVVAVQRGTVEAWLERHHAS